MAIRRRQAPRRPLATHDAVYVGGRESTPLYALDAGTGRIRWKAAFGQNTLAWRFDGGKDLRGAWGPFGGVVYLTSSYDMTYAVHAETGRLLWSCHAGMSQRVGITGDGTVALHCYSYSGNNTVYGLRV
ncbi:hypothetical protein NE235_04335 [Actinoallomurus spadix]|uniref:Uncharacterized protein n=1 Tax=Actinoallomurus spadix TaxID=79912 RepID=A0ABN0W1E7_9ACTN|nr:hypothetical protein [Actinoallomurus spadix]MCO5985332.1 hypothetical protein [Actinoallomurus spadix]